MASTLPPDVEEVELEQPISDDGTIGGDGGPRQPEDDPHNNPEGYPDRNATPLGAYRLITFWTIFSVAMLFATLTFMVKERWAGSDDWVSVALPHVLYLDTGILLASSVTIELARNALCEKGSRECVRWLGMTLLLGIAFLTGQIVAWRELVSQGLYLGSNPGSFFVYLISGTHGVHLLGGIAALAFVAAFFPRWQAKPQQEAAVDAVALYWHFMDALWVYLLVLLVVTVQR